MTWPFSAELTAGIVATLSAIAIEIVRRVVNHPDVRRAARKNLREEIGELWARIDAQDERLATKDSEIAKLKNDVATLNYYKERYQTTALENEELRRQVGSQNQRIADMQKHIESLEQRVRELQQRRSRSQP